MMHLDPITVALRSTLATLAASLLCALAPAQSLPLPTTLEDFKAPGTQPLEVHHPVVSSQSCVGCHSGYDPDQEPYSRWVSSMKGQSGRDPVFFAALAVANQDAGFAGEFCLRCHAPSAWLDGRSTPPDGSGLMPGLGDTDGVTCNLCHRMVDPFLSPENPPVDERILLHLDRVPTTPHNAQYVIDLLDVRRGPFDLGPNFFYHEWKQSPYHRESLLCGTCHDISNPTLSRQLDGTYQLNPVNQEHPTTSKFDQFPIERVYSEWVASEYARREVDTIDNLYPQGRFGGNKTSVATCQDCHMPDTTGTACQPVLGGAVRNDLPMHNFNGVNSWVLNAVRSLYPDSETGLTAQLVADSHARTLETQQRAADLYAFNRNGDLAVRVVNQTGHKLPTGYSEGRRMWLNVQFFNAGDQLVAERGAYDATTATLTTNDTKVYQGDYGIDAQQSAATGLPAGKSFHFVLNNTIVEDNRIPPRGYTSAGFEAVQSHPVGVTYAEEQYWDETTFTPPAGAVRATVNLFHQTTSKEYIEFLRDTNTTNGDGLIAYQQWDLHGKSAPVLKQTQTIDLATAPCVPPIAYGLAKIMSNGGIPELGWTGTPSQAATNFNLVVSNGLPRSQGILQKAATSASVPYQGGTLLLGPGRTTVASFQLDTSGSVVIPINITGAMIGTQLNYQAFFRDRNAPQPQALTNALHVEFCP
jgi:hypothetical protein